MAFTGFKTKKKYNFNTLAPQILGDRYTLMEVVLITTVEEIVKYGFHNIIDTNTKLLNVIPGLNSNANDNNYIIFKNADGEKTVLAEEWIDINTVAMVDTVNIRIDIPNKSTVDVDVIKTILKEHGYNGINVYTY